MGDCFCVCEGCGRHFRLTGACKGVVCLCLVLVVCGAGESWEKESVWCVMWVYLVRLGGVLHVQWWGSGIPAAVS